jgi:YjbE family integral membrane protein
MIESLMSGEAVSAFLQVMMINVVLSGDNAIVIGMAAAGLPKEQRGKAILFGMIAAIVLRILFALVATSLMGIKGVLLAGGLLLAWICWNMWRELQTGGHQAEGVEAITGEDHNADGAVAGSASRKTFKQAAWQIVIADVSMSLDNVLAVAGAARDQPVIMITGLILSIAIMGIAATLIARLLEKFRWIAYVGLAIIVYVSAEMIWEGSHEILPLLLAKLA